MASSSEKQISAFIPRDVLSDLVNILLTSTEFQKAPLTNKYEVVRGRLYGKLIIAYSSGKVVYDESEEVRMTVERLLYEKYKDEGIVVGSDEAGKGEAIGPLVIAAAALDPRQSAYLQSLGVADSKIVPEGRMKELANAVKRKSIAYDVLRIDPVKFNQVFDASKSLNRNLNDILAWGHSKVLQSIIGKIPDKTLRVIVDDFDTSKRKVKIAMIEGMLHDRRVQAMPGAEVFPAVAAASILARNNYLEWIRRNLSESQIQRLAKRDYDIVRTQEEFLKYFKVSYVRKLADSARRRGETS